MVGTSSVEEIYFDQPPVSFNKGFCQGISHLQEQPCPSRISKGWQGDDKKSRKLGSCTKPLASFIPTRNKKTAPWAS